jgi:hypothetical protein
MRKDSAARIYKPSHIFYLLAAILFIGTGLFSGPTTVRAAGQTDAVSQRSGIVIASSAHCGTNDGNCLSGGTAIVPLKVTSTGQYLIVNLARYYLSYCTGTPTAIYGSTMLTPMSSTPFSNGDWAQFELANPEPGTHNLTIGGIGACQYTILAASLVGVNLTNPHSAIVSGQGNSSTATVSVSAAPGGLVYSAIAAANSPDVTPGAPLVMALDGRSAYRPAAVATRSGSGMVPITWTMQPGSYDYWAITSTPFNPGDGRPDTSVSSGQDSSTAPHVPGAAISSGSVPEDQLTGSYGFFLMESGQFRAGALNAAANDGIAGLAALADQSGLDAHIYCNDGRHVGPNYSNGGVDNGLSAKYGGSSGSVHWIIVPAAKMVGCHFAVGSEREATFVKADANSNFKLTDAYDAYATYTEVKSGATTQSQTLSEKDLIPGQVIDYVVAGGVQVAVNRLGVSALAGNSEAPSGAKVVDDLLPGGPDTTGGSQKVVTATTTQTKTPENTGEEVANQVPTNQPQASVWPFVGGLTAAVAVAVVVLVWLLKRKKMGRRSRPKLTK